MPSYVITGNVDEACAQLKNTLKAGDARFDAGLKAAFKTNTRPAPKPMQPPPAQDTAARGGFGSGASLSLTRRNDDGGNMRSRLRGSSRSTHR